MKSIIFDIAVRGLTYLLARFTSSSPTIFFNRFDFDVGIGCMNFILLFSQISIG